LDCLERVISCFLVEMRIIWGGKEEVAAAALQSQGFNRPIGLLVVGTIIG